MKRICPNPQTWAKVHAKLCAYSDAITCQPASPPKPLILAGWNFSEDWEKERRWLDTVEWAEKNGATACLLNIQDWYEVTP